MQEEKIGIREILDRYGEQYITKHKIAGRKKGLIRLLSSCGTPALGSHFSCCDKCGHIEKANNSCRDRHCPNCQDKDKLEWTRKRMDELFPVGYYHIVFTLPHQLNVFCLQNKKLMYGILFKAASETILELVADPKHAGLKTGLISVLHTWGQSMTDHIHLHCLMPAGGFDPGGNWGHIDRKDGFLVHYKVISRLFRKKFMALMDHAFEKSGLNCNGILSRYKSKPGYLNFSKSLSNRDWVVNIQAPMGNPGKILEYLSRYVFRVAISNNRINAVADGKVHFSYKDNQTGLYKPMKLDADEFTRRFLLHVLPERFPKVRYYGIFTNRCRKENIKKARESLEQQNEIQYREALEDGGTAWKKQDTAWDEIKTLMLTIKQPNCPECKKGRMRFSGMAKHPYLEPG
ncbi:MAG: IS91 family transposase [Bacteroidota bacterium]